MKLTNDVIHDVVGDTFVMCLLDLVNDATIVKFMVTKDKKYICYLDHFSSSMKNHGYKSFNVLVDRLVMKKYHVNSKRTSHSEPGWDKLDAVLNRSSFESTAKMLELNTDNKIMFVVERMRSTLLLKIYEPVNSTFMFFTGLNELDIIKLKLLNEVELKVIIEGNSKLYNDRIEDRLFGKICNFMNQLMMEVFLV